MNIFGKHRIGCMVIAVLSIVVLALAWSAFAGPIIRTPWTIPGSGPFYSVKAEVDRSEYVKSIDASHALWVALAREGYESKFVMTKNVRKNSVYYFIEFQDLYFDMKGGHIYKRIPAGYEVILILDYFMPVK